MTNMVINFMTVFVINCMTVFVINFMTVYVINFMTLLVINLMSVLVEASMPLYHAILVFSSTAAGQLLTQSMLTRITAQPMVLWLNICCVMFLVNLWLTVILFAIAIYAFLASSWFVFMRKMI